MAASGEELLKIGILSLGDMGAGIASLLNDSGFQVASNCTGRSQDTLARAKRAGVELLSSDIDLLQQCHIILSVVPPRDAEETAQRIADALAGSSREGNTRDLYFADLNAVSPSTCRRIASRFDRLGARVAFIDGCIIGGPPKKKQGLEAVAAAGVTLDERWYRPSIPISGPHSLSSLPRGDELASLLRFRSISPEIGSASALKMSFAALSKGTIAIATQSLAAARRGGVLGELEREAKELIPAVWDLAARVGPGMPPKAYRWVGEMEEIATTFAEEAGWETTLFEGVAGVYRTVAEDDVLGRETTERRVRGKDLDDLARCVAEGLQRKKEKTD